MEISLRTYITLLNINDGLDGKNKIIAGKRNFSIWNTTVITWKYIIEQNRTNNQLLALVKYCINALQQPWSYFKLHDQIWIILRFLQMTSKIWFSLLKFPCKLCTQISVCQLKMYQIRLFWLDSKFYKRSKTIHCPSVLKIQPV